MDKFQQTYLDSFFKNAIIEKSLYIENVCYKTSIHNFLKNIVKFYQSDLILEQHTEYTKLEQSIYNTKSSKIIPYNQLKLLLPYTSKLKQINSNVKIKIYVLNFQNPIEIYNILAKNHIFKIDSNNKEIQKQSIINEFKINVYGTTGVVIPYQNIYFMFINSNTSTKHIITSM